MYQNGLTRRDFLRGTASAALTATAITNSRHASASETESSPKAKVVLVRDPEALTPDGLPNGLVLARMLDQAVSALTEKEAPQEAWKSLFKPDDIVGVKTNVWRFLPTPKELEEAIRARVLETGVAPDHIAIEDRGVRTNPVFSSATALINTRPMRTHHWSGVGSLIKNYICFHENPSSWHDDSCANLAGLWDMPVIKGKTRLNILVMLTPLYHGKGPHDFQKRYTWEYKGLLVGVDPVAVDATGLRILEAKRLEVFGEQLPFAIPPKHIRIAQDKFHLGVADPDKINLVALGQTDGSLII